MRSNHARGRVPTGFKFQLLGRVEWRGAVFYNEIELQVTVRVLSKLFVSGSSNKVCLFFFSLPLKEYTRKSTAPHPLTGVKAIRSRIVVTSFCSFPTQRTDAVDSKLVESHSTLLWPGFRSSLDSRLYCITSSKVFK